MVIESDWLDAIIGLPDQLFYNTGISTYFWIVTNRKRSERRGNVQLIDARELFVKMRKSLGDKRKFIDDAQIAEITRLYGAFEENEQVKILPNESFGYLRITVDRPLRLRYEVRDTTLPLIEASPAWLKSTESEQAALLTLLGELDGFSSTDRTEAARRLGVLAKPIEKAVWDAISVRDPHAPIMNDRTGAQVLDPALRDSENVPLPGPTGGFDADPTARLATPPYRDAVERHFNAEVVPYMPNASVSQAKTSIGYELPFTRIYYRYIPPRPLDTIDSEIARVTEKVQRALAGLEA